MFHVMLHVRMTASKNFETEGTEEIFRVVMSYLEMCLDFHEKRGPEIAHLKTRKCVGTNQWMLTIGDLIHWFNRTWELTWHMYGISPGLWVSFMCSSRTCSVSNANSHILQLAKMVKMVGLVCAKMVPWYVSFGSRLLCRTWRRK